MKDKTRILIIDDDVMTCKSLSLIFQKKGYETESATTGKEALEITKKNSFNIALLDLKLPDMEEKIEKSNGWNHPSYGTDIGSKRSIHGWSSAAGDSPWLRHRSRNERK
jgi:DNA-binding LytR/AlgR family response regulator